MVETIDAKLTKDNEGDDDEDQYADEQQVIRLKLDLGKVEDNPLIDFLSSDIERDSDGECQKHLPEEEATEQQKAILKLLAATEDSSTASKKRKLLIEDM